MNSKILLYLFSLLLLSSCKYDLDMVYSERQKIRVGDSLEWAQPSIVDTAWANYGKIPGDSIFWVRQDISLKELQGKKNIAICVSAIGSYDLYWDGIYMYSNGTPKVNENTRFKEGTYVHYAIIPDSLLVGDNHLIAMRSYNPYEELGQHSFTSIGNHLDITTSSLKVSLYMFFVGGLFFIAGLFFIITFFVNRQDYSALIFGTICLVFLALLILEYLKLFYPYQYSFQRTRLVYIGYLHAFLSFLIPAFFAIQFKFKYWKYLFGIIFLGVLYLELAYCGEFDYLAKMQNKFMWVSSFIIILYACWKKQKEGFIVLGAFIASMMVFWLARFFRVPHVSSFDISLFLSFLCIIFSMLYIMTDRRKKERQAYEKSLITSERLKNELLKKNIKPHFIMNTLTTLIDWVEESPEEGVGLIHALANEFEVLNDIADYKLVPIGQEIKLCKSHLKVMGYRKEVEYEWVQEGIDENEIIPPAILHTIVENGVTHSRAGKSRKITFSLNYSKVKNYKKYTLRVSNMNSEKINVVAADVIEGTGTKYIRSRLQESFGDKWKYESGPDDQGWISTITIFN